jgi:hypothetical protein
MGYEKQCGEDVACCQYSQRSRPKDSGLSKKQSCNDQLGDEHDRVDHWDERNDFAPLSFSQTQCHDSSGEQQAYHCKTEPDLLPVRWCIEQPQLVLRHGSPNEGQDASMGIEAESASRSKLSRFTFET